MCLHVIGYNSFQIQICYNYIFFSWIFFSDGNFQFKASISQLICGGSKEECQKTPAQVPPPGWLTSAHSLPGPSMSDGRRVGAWEAGRWGRDWAEMVESTARKENSILSRRSRWKPGKWQALWPSSRAIGKDEQSWQLQSRKKLSCSKSRLLQMSLGWSFNQGGIAWLSWVWELKGVTFLPGKGEPSLLPLSILCLFPPFYLSYTYPLLFGENFMYVLLLRVDRC